MSGKATIIILHESVAVSWMRDASTLVLFVALIGLGWVVGSSAMQWAGFFVAVVILISKAQNKRLSFDQARAEIDRIEAEVTAHQQGSE